MPRLASRFPLLTAAFVVAGLSAAHADILPPMEGLQSNLGDVSVITYYTSTPSGYHLVATAQVAGTSEGGVMRFEATLQAGQTTTISVPRPLGEMPVKLVFRRDGDTLRVEPPAPAIN